MRAGQSARPTLALLDFVRRHPRRSLVSGVFGMVGKHNLVAGLAQPCFVATQAGDDFADIRDVVAAQPEDVRLASILLLHRALRNGRAATANRRCDDRDSDQVLSQKHCYLH
jgi:hypothetical protein